MSPFASHRTRTSRRKGVLTLAATGLLLAGQPSLAQQATELRGEVLENRINNDLLNSTASQTSAARQGGALEDTGFDPGRYAPASVGAVPEDSSPTNAGVADSADTTTADPEIFSGDLLTQPTPAQTPSERARASATGSTASRAQVRGAAAAGSRAVRAQAAEEELTTGTVRAGRINGLDETEMERIGKESDRVAPIEGLGRTPEENPFAPVGIRAGNFILTPTLEQGLGWTSNANSSTDGKAALFSESALRLNAISDWSRHSASVQADGLFRKSISGESISEFDGSVQGDLRLDLGNEFSATSSLGYRIGPESASSPVDFGNTVSQPQRQTISGSVGLAKDVGKLRLGIKGDVARDTYGDAELETGGILSQRDRNSTLTTATLRLGYELSPALAPFAEVEIGRRFHDQRIDSVGYERSADRYGARAGVAFDLGDKLRGELSAGWLTERPDDERLGAISGASVAGNIAWSPVRGTVVDLNGATEVEGSTTAGESGSLLYTGSLSVTRELRANLTGTALLGIDWRDYAGSTDHDLVMRGEARLTWWMNRYAGVTGRLRHEMQRSNLPGRTYDASSVYLGMTLQR